jgi:3-hydroxy-9,10-secoandrosta-1,3,5(10)-triene-9,17-dione monooxygenase reductase component
VATELEREQFRSVMGHFATGVTVITGHGPDGPAGMTTSAIASLSLDPILVIVCFDNTSRTLPVVREAGRFGLNVLRAEQEPLARVFASKVDLNEKFRGVGWQLEDAVPILDRVLAWLACEVRELVPGGDHTIAIGSVLGMYHAEGEPLVWYRGGYRGLD